MEEKHNTYIAIVAIVAVVALIVLVLSAGTNNRVSSTNTAAQAYAATDSAGLASGGLRTCDFYYDYLMQRYEELKHRSCYCLDESRFVYYSKNNVAYQTSFYASSYDVCKSSCQRYYNCDIMKEMVPSAE